MKIGIVIIGHGSYKLSRYVPIFTWPGNSNSSLSLQPNRTASRLALAVCLRMLIGGAQGFGNFRSALRVAAGAHAGFLTIMGDYGALLAITGGCCGAWAASADHGCLLLVGAGFGSEASAMVVRVCDGEQVWAVWQHGESRAGGRGRWSIKKQQILAC